MAQELTFIIDNKDFICSPSKVERSKIYGSTEKVILDNKNETCKTVSMDESGTVIIPKGGIAFGILDNNYNWVQRNQLHAVTLQGENAELISSSFSTPITLDKKVDIETFLDHSITTVYQLVGNYKELIDLIGNDIYSFSFNYRNSYESSPAFLIVSGDSLFMLVGFKNDFEFINLQETSVLDVEDDNTEESDDFDIDFSMM